MKLIKLIRRPYLFDEVRLTFDDRLRQEQTNGNFPLLEERVILNEFDICKADSRIF